MVVEIYVFLLSNFESIGNELVAWGVVEEGGIRVAVRSRDCPLGKELRSIYLFSI